MRHHFHRCPNLRVVSIDASDISGDRKGGGVILDELCQAKKLTRCVGLAEGDILSDQNRRELLVTRVTELREKTGGRSVIGDVGGLRGREIIDLAEELRAERAEILKANRRRLAEAVEALDAQADDASLGTNEDLASRPDLSAISPAFRSARLDAIDSALEAMGDATYGVCARCGGLIDPERLYLTPDTYVCRECATSAIPAL